MKKTSLFSNSIVRSLTSYIISFLYFVVTILITMQSIVQATVSDWTGNDIVIIQIENLKTKNYKDKKALDLLTNVDTIAEVRKIRFIPPEELKNLLNMWGNDGVVNVEDMPLLMEVVLAPNMKMDTEKLKDVIGENIDFSVFNASDWYKKIAHYIGVFEIFSILNIWLMFAIIFMVTVILTVSNVYSNRFTINILLTLGADYRFIYSTFASENSGLIRRSCYVGMVLAILLIILGVYGAGLETLMFEYLSKISFIPFIILLIFPFLSIPVINFINMFVLKIIIRRLIFVS